MLIEWRSGSGQKKKKSALLKLSLALQTLKNSSYFRKRSDGEIFAKEMKTESPSNLGLVLII
jgi:hypothetical protein